MSSDDYEFSLAPDHRPATPTYLKLAPLVFKICTHFHWWDNYYLNGRYRRLQKNQGYKGNSAHPASNVVALNYIKSRATYPEEMSQKENFATDFPNCIDDVLISFGCEPYGRDWKKDNDEDSSIENSGNRFLNKNKDKHEQTTPHTTPAIAADSFVMSKHIQKLTRKDDMPTEDLKLPTTKEVSYFNCESSSKVSTLSRHKRPFGKFFDDFTLCRSKFHTEKRSKKRSSSCIPAINPSLKVQKRTIRDLLHRLSTECEATYLNFLSHQRQQIAQSKRKNVIMNSNLNNYKIPKKQSSLRINKDKGATMNEQTTTTTTNVLEGNQWKKATNKSHTLAGGNEIDNSSRNISVGQKVQIGRSKTYRRIIDINESEHKCKLNQANESVLKRKNIDNPPSTKYVRKNLTSDVGIEKPTQAKYYKELDNQPTKTGCEESHSKRRRSYDLYEINNSKHSKKSLAYEKAIRKSESSKDNDDDVLHNKPKFEGEKFQRKKRRSLESYFDSNNTSVSKTKYQHLEMNSSTAELKETKASKFSVKCQLAIQPAIEEVLQNQNKSRSYKTFESPLLLSENIINMETLSLEQRKRSKKFLLRAITKYEKLYKTTTKSSVVKAFSDQDPQKWKELKDMIYSSVAQLMDNETIENKIDSLLATIKLDEFKLHLDESRTTCLPGEEEKTRNITKTRKEIHEANFLQKIRDKKKIISKCLLASPIKSSAQLGLMGVQNNHNNILSLPASFETLDETCTNACLSESSSGEQTKTPKLTTYDEDVPRGENVNRQNSAEFTVDTERNHDKRDTSTLSILKLLDADVNGITSDHLTLSYDNANGSTVEFVIGNDGGTNQLETQQEINRRENVKIKESCKINDLIASKDSIATESDLKSIKCGPIQDSVSESSDKHLPYISLSQLQINRADQSSTSVSSCCDQKKNDTASEANFVKSQVTDAHDAGDSAITNDTSIVEQPGVYNYEQVGIKSNLLLTNNENNTQPSTHIGKACTTLAISKDLCKQNITTRHILNTESVNTSKYTREISSPVPISTESNLGNQAISPTETATKTAKISNVVLSATPESTRHLSHATPPDVDFVKTHVTARNLTINNNSSVVECIQPGLYNCEQVGIKSNLLLSNTEKTHKISSRVPKLTKSNLSKQVMSQTTTKNHSLSATAESLRQTSHAIPLEVNFVKSHISDACNLAISNDMSAVECVQPGHYISEKIGIKSNLLLSNNEKNSQPSTHSKDLCKQNITTHNILTTDRAKKSKCPNEISSYVPKLTESISGNQAISPTESTKKTATPESLWQSLFESEYIPQSSSSLPNTGICEATEMVIARKSSYTGPSLCKTVSNEAMTFSFITYPMDTEAKPNFSIFFKSIPILHNRKSLEIENNQLSEKLLHIYKSYLENEISNDGTPQNTLENFMNISKCANRFSAVLDNFHTKTVNVTFFLQKICKLNGVNVCMYVSYLLLLLIHCECKTQFGYLFLKDIYERTSILHYINPKAYETIIDNVVKQLKLPANDVNVFLYKLARYNRLLIDPERDISSEAENTAIEKMLRYLLCGDSSLGHDESLLEFSTKELPKNFIISSDLANLEHTMAVSSVKLGSNILNDESVLGHIHMSDLNKLKIRSINEVNTHSNNKSTNLNETPEIVSSTSTPTRVPNFSPSVYADVSVSRSVNNSTMSELSNNSPKQYTAGKTSNIYSSNRNILNSKTKYNTIPTQSNTHQPTVPLTYSQRECLFKQIKTFRELTWSLNQYNGVMKHSANLRPPKSVVTSDSSSHVRRFSQQHCDLLSNNQKNSKNKNVSAQNLPLSDKANPSMTKLSKIPQSDKSVQVHTTVNVESTMTVSRKEENITREPMVLPTENVPSGLPTTQTDDIHELENELAHYHKKFCDTADKLKNQYKENNLPSQRIDHIMRKYSLASESGAEVLKQSDLMMLRQLLQNKDIIKLFEQLQSKSGDRPAPSNNSVEPDTTVCSGNSFVAQTSGLLLDEEVIINDDKDNVKIKCEDLTDGSKLKINSRCQRMLSESTVNVGSNSSDGEIASTSSRCYSKREYKCICGAVATIPCKCNTAIYCSEKCRKDNLTQHEPSCNLHLGFF